VARREAKRQPIGGKYLVKMFTVDQPLKNEYQDTPGGKDARCVRLTTYHLQVPMSRNLGALNSHNPLGPIGL
jgi:hypothetical protein